MAKVIRLTEKDITRLVNKIIKEDIGDHEFSNRKELDNNNEGNLRPATAKLKGVDHIVVIDNNGYIVGYGPAITSSMSQSHICSIAESLIKDWEEESAVRIVREYDQQDFQSAKPITFCSR